ncbi:MAG: VOC family protein [Methylococcales bacterium]|nr:VOC family protein [Methylococcales bacterium]
MIYKQFDHVGLNVRDLDKSIAFYQEMFGFALIEKWADPKQAFIGANEAVLGLMEVQDYDFCAYTMAHIAFPCAKNDFAVVVAKVKSLELEIVSGPKSQRGGETILFRDPSGNILEVCYPSIREWMASQI